MVIKTILLLYINGCALQKFSERSLVEVAQHLWTLFSVYFAEVVNIFVFVFWK